jgi:hypothetical protein
MKIKNIIAVLGIVSLVATTSCSPEDDIRNPTLNTPAFTEDFSAGAVDNTDLNTPGWSNIAEVGTAKWKEQIYSGNAYAEFSSFQSGNAVNVAWLISPEVDLSNKQNQVLAFRASQSFVSSSENSLEVLIATDYDGTNLATANWQNLSATLPTTSSAYFAFIQSGLIDLSAYSGKVNIAFKVKGSGTNTNLDGSYQVDDVNIFTKI